MMNTPLQLRSELDAFAELFIGPETTPNIAPAPRKFEAMADVESLLWLQLAVELGVFPAKEADGLFDRFGQRILYSIGYVEAAGLWRSFDSMQQTFCFLAPMPGFSFELPVYPNRLSSKLFDQTLLLMVLHEVGREFRDGVFTTSIAFEPPDDWRHLVVSEPDPDVILQSRDLRGANLLVDRYLAFLDHAGNLMDLWRHLDRTDSHGYGLSELQRRVRAMHNWRVNLADDDVKARFEVITGAFTRGTAGDAELTSLGFDVTALRDRIESLCRSWTGDERLILNVPTDGGRQVYRAA